MLSCSGAPPAQHYAVLRLTNQYCIHASCWHYRIHRLPKIRHNARMQCQRVTRQSCVGASWRQMKMKPWGIMPSLKGSTCRPLYHRTRAWSYMVNYSIGEDREIGCVPTPRECINPVWSAWCMNATPASNLVLHSCIMPTKGQCVMKHHAALKGLKHGSGTV